MKNLFLIQKIENDFKTTKFTDKESLAKYIKNNPTLTDSDYIIIKGEIQHHKGRYIYDGRFQ